MPEDISNRLDAWGRDECEAIGKEATVLPPTIRDAVAQASGSRRMAVVARWAPLAAAALLVAVLGFVALNTSTPEVADDQTPAVAGSATDFTLLGLMRANDHYSSETLVLPDVGVVGWTSRTPPLER